MLIVLGGRIYQPMVGWGSLSSVCAVSSAGLPAWGHFGNLGLGTGSLPSELCHFLTSDVCLLERVARCDNKSFHKGLLYNLSHPFMLS